MSVEISVHVFIDNSSLYRAMLSMSMGHVKVDYDDLLQLLLGERQLARAGFYCSEFRNDHLSRLEFYSVLESLGLQIFVSHLVGHRSKRSIAALDRTLSNSIRNQIDFDTEGLSNCPVILVAGGAEYVDVVNKLVSRGCDVEVVFFESVCSYALINRATRFREIKLRPINKEQVAM